MSTIQEVLFYFSINLFKSGEIAVKNTKGEVGETDKSFTFDIVIPPSKLYT